MPTPIRTSSNKPKTPFLRPSWPWNHIVPCGTATRERCHSIVAPEEAEAGVKLIADYREWETIAAANDIESRQQWLDKESRVRTVSGVEVETLRREMTRADHSKYLEAEAKLAELRKEAFEMAGPLFKRLISDLSNQLHETTVGAEQRLADAGIPLKDGDKWLLHDDSLCKALWSQRHIAERTLSELSPDSAIGAIQWLCSREDGVPFAWQT